MKGWRWLLFGFTVAMTFRYYEIIHRHEVQNVIWKDQSESILRGEGMLSNLCIQSSENDRKAVFSIYINGKKGNESVLTIPGTTVCDKTHSDHVTSTDTVIILPVDMSADLIYSSRRQSSLLYSPIKNKKEISK